MKFLIIGIFILIPNISKSDALLDAIYSSFNEEVYEKNYESTESAETDGATSDAEVYHWELGTPDNIPETVIIYTQSSSCGCY